MIYLRGRKYWWRGTIAGRERRQSLRTTDPTIAQMRATSIERYLAVKEMMTSDAALRRQLRDALLGDGVGWVYFVSSGKAIKIGFTRKLTARLATLQTHSVDPVRLLKKLRGTTADEKAWHTRFAHLRLRGEWFRASRALLTAIKSARGGR